MLITKHKKAYLVVIGTAAGTGQGGISTALPGYLEALSRAGIMHVFVTSHEGGGLPHKFRVYFSGVRQMISALRDARSKHCMPVLYVHLGPWLSMLRKLSFVWLGKLMGAKVICQVHSLSLARYLENPIGKWLCRFFFWQMDRVLVLTEWWHSRLAGAGIGNLAILPNPLGPHFERVARKAILLNPAVAEVGNSIKLLCIARLVSGKGVEWAIQALAHLPPEFHLSIAGAGPLRAELESLHVELGLEGRVTFLGWVSGDDRLALFENHDIFLLPSQNDSFGMGFVEAMAYGLPVVALKWGAIADVVPDGKAGLLVDKPEATLLADAVMQITPATKRQAMGLFGQQWVLQQFSIDSISIRLSRIVNELQSQKDL